MIRTPRLLLTAFATTLLLGGCVNPFAPGTPPAPNGGPFVSNFTTPEKLLDTIAAAISAEGDGAVAYGDAIADSTSSATPFGFYAVPDAGVLSAWRATPGNSDPYDPGDVRHERLFFSDLLQVLASYDYVFQFASDTYSQNDDIGAETAVLHRYYQLDATSTDGRLHEIIAVGFADLTVRKYNGRWWLVRWVDRVDPTYGINPPNAYNRTMGARRLEL